MCPNILFNSVIQKKKRKGRKIPRIVFPLFCHDYTILYPFRSFWDATDLRRNCAVRFAVQIIYLSHQQVVKQIKEGILGMKVSTAIGNTFWNRLRTINLMTNREDKVSRVHLEITRRHRYWIWIISSHYWGKCNFQGQLQYQLIFIHYQLSWYTKVDGDYLCISFFVM